MAGGDINNAKEPVVPTDELDSLSTAPHPDAAEIVKQVDYYFSEENLRGDAHLLGLIKEGDGLVSINEILSWKKMRRYRPMSAVREALKQSEVVEVVGTKRLRRKHPLEGPVYVVAAVRSRNDNKKTVVPEDKPWLTKNMRKPTGFEDGMTDGPTKPEEHESDRQAYDPENTFTCRIETAIMKFCAKRKWHARARDIWEKFLLLGGFDAGQKQFTGGLDEKSMEDYTKKEIAELTAQYAVSGGVMNGLYEDGPDGHVTWVVDFEALAKSFLSCSLLTLFDWQNEETISTATKVLRSFYNYLLHHDVCPEYREQVLAARAVCDLADIELPMMKQVDKGLPGNFNVACSTLHGGSFAGLYASTGDWCKEEDRIGMSNQDAKVILATAIASYGTKEQAQWLQAAFKAVRTLEAIHHESIGLEVVKITLCEGNAAMVYSDSRLANTVVKPLGKLHCKSWKVPHAAPRDIPAEVEKAAKEQTFVFMLEESILRNLRPGMKIEAHVWKSELEISWIDLYESVYPSFYTWLPNLRLRELKQSEYH